MKKKIKRFDPTNWHGVDASKETSLFEYGLLVRWVSEEQAWQCIYRNPYAGNMFSYGWATEKELEQTLHDSGFIEDLTGFLSYVGSDWSTWIAQSFAVKLHDFIQYHGAENLFGVDYSGGSTAREICRNIHVKFYPEYDKCA